MNITIVLEVMVSALIMATFLTPLLEAPAMALGPSGKCYVDCTGGGIPSNVREHNVCLVRPLWGRCSAARRRHSTSAATTFRSSQRATDRPEITTFTKAKALSAGSLGRSRPFVDNLMQTCFLVGGARAHSGQGENCESN